MEILFDDLDNNFETTLDGDITDASTTINLVDVPSNASEGFLAIDADNSEKLEYIYFNSKGAGFVSCPATGGRGQGGTTAVDHDSGAVVRMYVMREHIKGLLDALNGKTSVGNDGWLATSETVTYAAAQQVTVSASLAALLQKGAKFKCTNDSATKYFYVSGVSGTTVTLAGEVDLANSAITNVYFSYADCPFGFKPKSDYSASFYRSAAYNVSTGSELTVNVDTDDQSGNSISLVGGGYTVPITGWYLATVQVYFNSSLSGQMALIRVNDISKAYSGRCNGFGSATSKVLYVTKGDVIQLGAYQNTGVTEALQAGSRLRNYLTVQFIGV